MNSKAGYVFRIVLGGYLVWIGIQILIQMINERPSNMILMSCLAVIFIVIGGSYLYFCLKRVFKIFAEKRKIYMEKVRKKQTDQMTAKLQKEPEKTDAEKITKENTAEEKSTETAEESEAEKENNTEEKTAENKEEKKQSSGKTDNECVKKDSEDKKAEDDKENI